MKPWLIEITLGSGAKENRRGKVPSRRRRFRTPLIVYVVLGRSICSFAPKCAMGIHKYIDV
jgi:hypothetical protein